jgi:hypothetical protein
VAIPWAVRACWETFLLGFVTVLVMAAGLSASVFLLHATAREAVEADLRDRVRDLTTLPSSWWTRGT